MLDAIATLLNTIHWSGRSHKAEHHFDTDSLDIQDTARKHSTTRNLTRLPPLSSSMASHKPDIQLGRPLEGEPSHIRTPPRVAAAHDVYATPLDQQRNRVPFDDSENDATPSQPTFDRSGGDFLGQGPVPQHGRG